MEKGTKTKKFKHVNIFRILLVLVGFGSAGVFYMNLGNDYESLVSSLQSASLVLSAFVFLFTAFNLDLVASDPKGKKVYDRIIFYTFIFYITANSLSLMSRLDAGTLSELANIYGVTVQSLLVNHFLIVILTPVLILATMLWSIKKISPVTKKEKANSMNLLYYFFVFLSLLGLAYSVVMPLYTLN